MEILVEQLKSVDLLINKEIHKIDEVAQRDYLIPLSLFVAVIDEVDGVDCVLNEVTLLNERGNEGCIKSAQVEATKMNVYNYKVLEKETETSMPLVTVFQDLQ